MYQNYQNNVEIVKILFEIMKVKLAEIHPDTFVSKQGIVRKYYRNSYMTNYIQITLKSFKMNIQELDF